LYKVFFRLPFLLLTPIKYACSSPVQAFFIYSVMKHIFRLRISLSI
jgi:hypothetical protein